MGILQSKFASLKEISHDRKRQIKYALGFLLISSTLYYVYKRYMFSHMDRKYFLDKIRGGKKDGKQNFD